MDSETTPAFKVIREGRNATVLLDLLNRGKFSRVAVSVVKVFHGDTVDHAAMRKAKEEFFLARVTPHPNIVERAYLANESADTMLVAPNIRLEFIPYGLNDFLASPPAINQWPHVARSLAFQLCCALEFLHGRGIAHRDVNPSNLMIDHTFVLKIIDFGSACLVRPHSPEDESRVLETPAKMNMDYQVGTGPYRAPELLFGSTTYDTFAIDSWAMGAVIAELFSTAVVARLDNRNPSQRPIPRSPVEEVDISALSLHDDGPGNDPQRQSLFDASFGDLGLAASIFRLRGIPTPEVWPGFEDLPDANKFQFEITPGSLGAYVALIQHAEPEYRADLLDLLDGLLRLDPAHRLTPSTALGHAWFSKPDPILVSTDYYVELSKPGSNRPWSRHQVETRVKGIEPEWVMREFQKRRGSQGL